MFDTLTHYRRMAEAQEVALMARTTALAARIDPPFTPRKRQAIREALAACTDSFAQLSRIWHAQLMSPESRSQPLHHPDRLHFQALQGRMRLWGQTCDLLAAVLARKQLSLMPDGPANHSPEHGQLLAYQRNLDRLHGYFSPTPPNLYGFVSGRHGDIPYPFTGFFRLMQMVRRILLAQGRQAPLSFLDVGCGVGLKLVQAADFFDVVQGLEFDPERAAVAATLVQRSRRVLDRAFQGDALEFGGYGDFDVIYAFKPLADPNLLQQMEKRILAQARPGSILILPYFEFDFRFEDLGCTRIYDKVFVTGGAGRNLKPLLRRIADIGTTLPDPDAYRPEVEGFAAPVRQALRHWGHLA